MRTIDIVKEGWVYKQSRQLKQWKERYLVLTKTHAMTYKKEKLYNEEDPTEILVLHDMRSVQLDETKKYKGCATFTLTANNADAFPFCAKQTKDTQDWVRILKLEIDLARNRKVA